MNPMTQDADLIPISSASSDAQRELAIALAKLMADDHCQDILVFDVRGRSPLTDFILLATGTSDRQIKSVGQHLEELASEHGFDRLGVDRDEAATWLVLDFLHVMAHLFEPVARAHYDLEMMWSDAPRVAWQDAPDSENV